MRHDLFAEHDSRGQVPIRLARSEHHGVGIGLQPLLPAFSHPLVEHHQGLGRQRVGEQLGKVFHKTAMLAFSGLWSLSESCLLRKYALRTCRAYAASLERELAQ